MPIIYSDKMRQQLISRDLMETLSAARLSVWIESINTPRNAEPSVTIALGLRDIRDGDRLIIYGQVVLKKGESVAIDGNIVRLNPEDIVHIRMDP